MTIKEQYAMLGIRYPHQAGEVDHLMCDVITTIKEIPGIEEAVLVAALKDNYHLRHFNPEQMGDIAFQYIWDKLMNPEEM